MKHIKMLSLILVALIAMGASCNRPPQPHPTQQGLNGEITTETITSETGAEGYSLSYRSWIVPGTDENGEKAPTPPKSVYNDNTSGGLGNASNSFERGGGVSETKSLAYDGKGGGHSNQNDTISVILHDTFYNVDTVGYVTTWDPDKYVQGSYTCHWDKYGLPRSGENNVIITDSTIVLRVQFEEFSFQYRINFETATYRDGVVNIPFPHHTPVITDLGVEELVDSLSICPDGQNVYARKLLQHSIRVSIGNKDYVLKAKVMLYRHLPDANPSKYILESILVPGSLQTYLAPDAELDNLSGSELLINVDFIIRRRWSDQSLTDEPISLLCASGIQAGWDSDHLTPLPSCPQGNTNGQIELTERNDDLGPITDNPYIHNCEEKSFNAKIYHDPSEGWQQPVLMIYTKHYSGYYDDGVLQFDLPDVDTQFEYSGTNVSCDAVPGVIYDTIRCTTLGISYYRVAMKRFTIQ
jgi:hypothetical protein